MRTVLLVTAVLLGAFAAPAWSAPTHPGSAKARIAIVDSYSRTYIWSQGTNRGVIAALLKYHYLDNPSQGRTFTQNDYVESSSAVIKKFWMETKKKNSRAQIAQATARIVTAINKFHPDVLLLGDDNATNYIGNQYVDTGLDMVFWGVDGSPLKYDLIDSLDHPGHNITGVYQSGHLREGGEWLKKLFPQARTIAVLSDASPTGRAKAKKLERLAHSDALPLALVANVVTNSFATWKKQALALRRRTDAFFVLNHNTLKDKNGHVVDQLKAGAWYLHHIDKPEVSNEKQFAVEGMLLAVGDSGYRQGYAAARIANRILAKGEDPAQIPVRPTQSGRFINVQRAKMLGVYTRIKQNPRIDEWMPTALALHDTP